MGQALWRTASWLLTAQHSGLWSSEATPSPPAPGSASSWQLGSLGPCSEPATPVPLPSSPSRLLRLAHGVWCFVASASAHRPWVSELCCILLMGAVSVWLLRKPPRRSGWGSSFCLAPGPSWMEFCSGPPHRSLVASCGYQPLWGFLELRCQASDQLVIYGQGCMVTRPAAWQLGGKELLEVALLGMQAGRSGPRSHLTAPPLHRARSTIQERHCLSHFRPAQLSPPAARHMPPL